MMLTFLREETYQPEVGDKHETENTAVSIQHWSVFQDHVQVFWRKGETFM